MKLDTVRRILKAQSEILKRGEHFAWSGLTHISKEAGLTRQTTYRYLEEMVVLGHCYKVEKTWRGEKCYRYYATKKGKELLASFKELSLDSVTNEK